MKLVILLISISFATIGSERIKIFTWNHTKEPQYHIFPLKTNFLEFNVKSEKDIKILLCNNYNLVPPYYEIVLGAHDNTVSLIRKAQDGKWLVTHHGVVLPKNDFQKFWVSMNKTEESISVGTKYNKPFLYLQDPNYVRMGYFGLANGSGAEGVWDFEIESMKW